MSDQDFARWEGVMREVRTLAREYPGRAENLWLKGFPNGSCSIVSFAIGAVLHQRYDEVWRLVSKASGFASHTWLTRQLDADTWVTIDATIDQFPQIAEHPFVGYGPSPVDTQLFLDYAPNSVTTDKVPDWWHHGATREVYAWMFPQLGISAEAAGVAVP